MPFWLKKKNSLLNRVLGVLCVFACLRAYVLGIFAYLHAGVLGVFACLRAGVLGVFACLYERALLTCFL